MMSYDTSGEPVLIGVTSIGVGCGFLPGAAVRISGHIAWLRSVGVPVTTYSAELPVVGPQCVGGEFIKRQSGVGTCARCAADTFSVPPAVACLRCPGNTRQDPDDGTRCNCKTYAELAVKGRGRKKKCVRCRKGFETKIGSNVCRRIRPETTAEMELIPATPGVTPLG